MMLLPIVIILFAAVASKAAASGQKPKDTQQATTVNRNIGVPNMPINPKSAVQMVPVGTVVPNNPAASSTNPNNSFVAPVAEDVTAGLVAGLFA